MIPLKEPVSTRSPILGYNHNFKHRGLVFHVQTEDSGVSNPHIFTHLFHGGVILSSRKLDYDAEASEEAVKALMQSQHKAVLKDLKQGTFDDKIDEYLGDHEELKPRKTATSSDTDEFNKPAERVDESPVPAIPQAVQEITDATVPHQIPEMIDDGATQRIPTAMPKQPPSKPGVATVFGPGPGVGRPRIPTPIAIPIDEAGTLGDPTVTFSDSSAVPKPVGTESSGAYSQVRRKVSKPPPIPPQASAPPSRPAGKSANPPPGRPKSSVVVSRPAVIIGAPPKVVGGGKAEAARNQTRRARPDPGLFGKDLISEKSLDEVILAYLSEDADD
jgi:hypothetical protein